MRFAFKTANQNAPWEDILPVWQEADGIELFESGWVFDHFYPIQGDPDGPCLEGWALLAALAQATTRLRLGALVTGVHYRHPAILANMASTIDIISGGRLEVGIGAGWNELESGAYGIELGSKRERSDRFEEATEVIISLLAQTETTFSGKYYQLKDARNEPKGPQRPHPPARCAPRPSSPSTGTSPAAPPSSSRTSGTCCASTAPTSGATRRRSSCPRTSHWTGPMWRARPRRRRRSGPRASTWRSCTCGRR